MHTQRQASRSAKKSKAVSKKSPRPPSPKDLTDRVKELEKVIRELAHERDLYRREWLRAKEEAAAVLMTDEECEAIVKEGITLDQVIAEIEQMQSGRPEHGN